MSKHLTNGNDFFFLRHAVAGKPRHMTQEGAAPFLLACLEMWQLRRGSNAQAYCRPYSCVGLVRLSLIRPAEHTSSLCCSLIIETKLPSSLPDTFTCLPRRFEVESLSTYSRRQLYTDNIPEIPTSRAALQPSTHPIWSPENRSLPPSPPLRPRAPPMQLLRTLRHPPPGRPRLRVASTRKISRTVQHLI